MAKKILSILCALAMMVTMVSVVAFSASADGEATSTTINLLDSTNINGWTLTRSCPNNWTNSNFSGNIDLTSLNLNGITGTLVQTQANHATYTDVTFDYNNGVSAIDFGDNFSILMTAYINAMPGTSTPDKDAYVSLKLGDYSVRLVHFVEDAVTETNVRDSFRIAVYHGETLVAVSDIIDSSVTTSLYNGAVSSSNTDAWKNTGTYGGYIKSMSKAANGAVAGGGVSFLEDNSWKDIEIVVNDNKMTIKTVAGVCGLHVLSGSDSADDVTTLSGFNTTALDLPSGTSFDGIVPQVVLDVDGDLRKNQAVGVFRLEGTIYAPEDSGDSTEPLAPGKFLSINDSLAINFAYAEGALADYTDVEVNASIGGKGETLTSVKKTLTDGVYDVYVVDFLTPDLFGTDVEFSITAKKGGADVSYETTYSVKDYCVNMMNASGSSNELKSLCAAILEYGEAARLWKLDEGKTAPATSITAGLTYTAPTKWTVGGKTSTFGLSGEPTNVVAEWGEFNLNLADNVGANLEVILDAGESIDNYYASVDGINVVGGDLESLVSLGNNKYKAVIRVYAYEMANDFTVKVKEVGTNEDVSYTFTTGVQNYILKGIETGVFVEGATDYNCAVALLTYGAAAAAYNS